MSTSIALDHVGLDRPDLDDPGIDLTVDLAPVDVEPDGGEAPRAAIERAVAAACGRIAPLWPLDRFVAVNPYLGLADLPFEQAAVRLAETSGHVPALPEAFYLDAVADGRIDPADLAAVAGPDVDALLAAARHAAEQGPAGAIGARRVPTVIDVVSEEAGTDWARFATDRIAGFAAAYFDRGQAMWRSADASRPLFQAWRDEASIDRTPEIMGLRRFRAAVRSLPADPQAAIDLAVAELGVPGAVLERYLHAVLLRMGGWAGHAARLAFEANLAGAEDDTLVQLLAVGTSWEVAVLRSTGAQAEWSAALARFEAAEARPALETVGPRLALQLAYDRAAQRRLVAALAPAGSGAVTSPVLDRPRAQAVFCIDVRSEVMRRHLEAVAADVATIGFAGFFGVAVDYLPLARSAGEARCPVLLRPGHAVAEAAGDATSDAVAGRARRNEVRRAWKSFKMGAISCFSFVGPVGLAYLPKLLSDGFGATRPVRRPELDGLPAEVASATGPDLGSGSIALAERISLAEGALRGMSARDGLAPLVAFVGHGSETANNPYATGLDCGACGGHAGDVNARIAAAILNDPAVRAGLAERGIHVPADTWFLGGLHNTTTDEVTFFDLDAVPSSHHQQVLDLQADLAEAGRRARAERAPRLGLDADDHEAVGAAVSRRSRDWAQVRPEWGLAGCQAFIAAPRERTRGIDLGGRAFLHSYDWHQDDGFAVLELIMSAPMVVASWISLQYFGSTVDNERLGSGNKVLHNVVGRLGVIEGNAGDLRTGLPWQSVHDGRSWQHEPVRLNVVIAAPIEAMNGVLAAHPEVAQLCDNGWVQLLAMDDQGAVSHRYVGGSAWEPVE